jgi:hypothetical protein
MKWFKWFVAGFLAVPTFHHIALWIFNAIGWTAMKPYSFAATKPFGVPVLISLAFWGGVWGLVLGWLLGRVRWYWTTAIVFGAIAPTLVAGFVVAPLKGMQVDRSDMRLVVVGLAVNAAWGLGTAVLYRLMNRAR